MQLLDVLMLLFINCSGDDKYKISLNLIVNAGKFSEGGGLGSIAPQRQQPVLEITTKHHRRVRAPCGYMYAWPYLEKKEIIDCVKELTTRRIHAVKNFYKFKPVSKSMGSSRRSPSVSTRATRSAISSTTTSRLCS